MIRKPILRGMLYGLPLTLGCWAFVYFNSKSHAAFVFANCWFGTYTALVLAGNLWPAKPPAFFAGLKRWYLRRFRGIVKPPAQYGGQGTTWQQHPRGAPIAFGFACDCGCVLAFNPIADLVVRSREHVEDCRFYSDPGFVCDCPITDARYIKICPQCHIGHWRDASPKGKS